MDEIAARQTVSVKGQIRGGVEQQLMMAMPNHPITIAQKPAGFGPPALAHQFIHIPDASRPRIVPNPSVCQGKVGELREPCRISQRASILNILINAISLRNSVYLTEAMKGLKAQGALDESLLAHIFPIGWEPINFLGEYQLDDHQVPT